jgi:hypothetical protein
MLLQGLKMIGPAVRTLVVGGGVFTNPSKCERTRRQPRAKLAKVPLASKGRDLQPLIYTTGHKE